MNLSSGHGRLASGPHLGGEHEVSLTADYNAEMIQHIARYPRVRDQAIFVGAPDDIILGTFGPGLPPIRDWTEQHFAGYITGFDPRQLLGYRNDQRAYIVTVGGSGVDDHSLPASRTRTPRMSS